MEMVTQSLTSQSEKSELQGTVRACIEIRVVIKRLQWNPSIAAALGEQHFGRYIGVACIEGLFCTQTVMFGT